MTHQEIVELLRKADDYSDQDLIEISRYAASSVAWGTVNAADVLQIRASVELIRAVRRFDKVSGRLAVVAILVALVSLVLSAIAFFRH